MKTAIWNMVNAGLGRLGYELCAKRRESQPHTMLGALNRIRQRGADARTVIDIGAAAGRWTRKAVDLFPDAQFLLVEPLEERRAPLQALRDAQPRVDFVIAAAGDCEGFATLTISPDLDGSGIYGGAVTGAEERQVALTTIDAEVQRRNLPGPFFLKFDTHGFELPIMLGATETLKRASVVVIEVYNFQLSPGCLRFHEMCARLESLGLRCVDLVDPMLRPLDGVLWQFDLVFLPESSPCFAEANYR